MNNVRFFVLTQTCVKAGKLPVTPAAPKDPLGGQTMASMLAVSSKRLRSTATPIQPAYNV